MILIVQFTDFIIVKNWNVIHEIADPNPLNTGKHSMLALPDFNVESLPFLVCSGARTINMINVKQGRMEEFIAASCSSKNVAFFQ